MTGIHAHLGPACDKCWRDGHRQGFVDGAAAERTRRGCGLLLLAAIVGILAFIIGFVIAGSVFAASGRQSFGTAVSGELSVSPAAADTTRLRQSGSIPAPGKADGTAIAGAVGPGSGADGAPLLAPVQGDDGKPCIDRVSNDAGPSLQRQREGRVADLSFLDFRTLCGCWPPSVGTMHVTIDRLGNLPVPTLPATDVTP